MLEQLWSPLVAVTAAHDGRSNGLISSTALRASLLPEAARVSVHLSKHSLTHDLVLRSGAFAVHLLPRDDAGLSLFRTLGMTSGHMQRKLDGVATRAGSTGSPVLVVLGDVVAAGGAADTEFLTIDDARARLPAEVLRQWAERFEAEVIAARRLRNI
jgi:hypothetical protein